MLFPRSPTGGLSCFGRGPSFSLLEEEDGTPSAPSEASEAAEETAPSPAEAEDSAPTSGGGNPAEQSADSSPEEEEEEEALSPLGEPAAASEEEVSSLLAKIDFSRKRLESASALRCTLRGVTSEDCAALGAALRESGALSRLTALDLSSNSIGPDGARCIAEAAAAAGGAPLLRELSLSENRLGDGGAGALSLLLRAAGPPPDGRRAEQPAEQPAEEPPADALVRRSGAGEGGAELSDSSDVLVASCPASPAAASDQSGTLDPPSSFVRMSSRHAPPPPPLGGLPCSVLPSLLSLSLRFARVGDAGAAHLAGWFVMRWAAETDP